MMRETHHRLVRALSLYLLLGILPGIAAAQPRLEAAETSFDFGKRIRYFPLIHIFEFSNEGNEDLEILGIKTNCGCVSQRISSSVLSPGAEGRIAVGHDPEMKRLRWGEQSFSATLITNSSDQANVEFVVKAELLEPVAVFPDEIHLRSAHGLESATGEFEILSLRDGVFPKVLSVKGSVPEISVERISERLETSPILQFDEILDWTSFAAALFGDVEDLLSDGDAGDLSELHQALETVAFSDTSQGTISDVSKAEVLCELTHLLAQPGFPWGQERMPESDHSQEGKTAGRTEDGGEASLLHRNRLALESSYSEYIQPYQEGRIRVQTFEIHMDTSAMGGPIDEYILVETDVPRTPLLEVPVLYDGGFKRREMLVQIDPNRLVFGRIPIGSENEKAVKVTLAGGSEPKGLRAVCEEKRITAEVTRQSGQGGAVLVSVTLEAGEDPGALKTHLSIYEGEKKVAEVPIYAYVRSER